MPAAATSSNLTPTLVYMALIMVVFYFMWFRPQQKQRKKNREMLSALVPGDRIMTAGGILGVVRSLDGDLVGLEIAAGVVVTVTKRAIIERVTDPAGLDEQ
jgi:preprotein translocase subunit YajC